MASSYLRMTLVERIKHFFRSLPWGFLVCLCAISLIGFFLLFDAAKGDFWEYSYPQFMKFAFGMSLALLIATIDIRAIYKYSYHIYFISLVLLALVPVFGDAAKGAQRWLDLGFFKFQPSEVVKITLILAMSKFYHRLNIYNISFMKNIIIAALIVLCPFIMVISQPDLGTSMMILMIGAGMMFMAGVSRIFFFIISLLGVISIPVFWAFVMKEYQKQRILTFLNPENDPLNSGYHIIQSKIAIGSAGFFGKGFMQGTQSHLAFLPEKHTDFIFALLAEDFGMFGSLMLILLYIILILSTIKIAMNNRNYFSSLVSMGVGFCIFLYAFINMAMVTGLMPVVGVPLPFISYGGTSMITLMVAVGLVLNASIQKEETLPKERKFS